MLDSKPGDRVFLDGKSMNTEPLPVLNDKKFKKAVEKFKSDAECFATFSGLKMMTTSGFISVKSLKNCDIR